MAKTDDPDHRVELAIQRLENADIDEQDKEAIKEFLKSINPDIPSVTFTNDKGEHETKAHNTRENYCQALKQFCELSGESLVDLPDATAVNAIFGELEDGTIDGTPKGGYSLGTLTQWQSSVTKFYEYHDDLGINHTDIVVKAQKDTSVDDRDMYTREEIEELRNAVTNTRDRCILELLLNTGQRIRAIQTLRVKDVDVENGVYYLNTDEVGLKGADKNGRKRPLLGAKRSVYDWLKNHPTSEPEDYLITTLPTANRGTPGEKLSQSNIRRRLKLIADDAGVDKPPNPHNFRHYFVTVCKRDYDMDDATIKHLIGHKQGSNIMETTYQHLSDEDHIKEAEIAHGLREEDNESPLTPTVCPTCAEQLEADAKACPGCGTVFAPSAKTTQDQIDDQMKESYKQTEPDDTDTQERLDTLDELLDDPEVKAALLEKLNQ